MRAPVWAGPPPKPWPRLEASCGRHGGPFTLCDHCASAPAMAAWSGGLSSEELATALAVLARGERYYTPAEERAILHEAAARILRYSDQSEE